jgi:hypothetical protein
MIKSNWLKILIIISGILILIPITLYILFFFYNDISNNPNDWGLFGDYFGGVLNPLIALFTLIILGYLTYLVSKTNTEETKNLFFLQQRIKAYQEISVLANNIDISIDLVTLRNDLMCRAGEFNIKEEIAKQYFKAMESTEKISQLKIGIQSFEKNYGHLFKYNFSSSDFIELKESLRLLYIERTAQSKKSKESIKEITLINEDRLRTLLDKFLSNLRQELI